MRDCADLTGAWIAAGNPLRGTSAERAKILQLAKASVTAVWGGSCLGSAQVATGRIDIAMDCRLDAHDFAAVVPVLEGAGGQATDWSGTPLTLDSAGQVLFLGNRRLQDDATSMLQGAMA